MDESFINTLEKRIKDMTDLRRIMNSMQHTLSEVKINVEDVKDFKQNLDDALKFTLQIKELDKWTLQTLRTFKKISDSDGFQCVTEKKLAKPKTELFVDLNKAKQGLIERGIDVLPEFEGEFQEIVNRSIIMTLDFLASKETSIKAAEKIISPYRKPKTKKPKAKKTKAKK
ncbi:MAG: hypothetical protein HWN66_06900 [Candidatus Helarchaeota archaeon]|nr:hypothetical protein [Candidatus Helarchaeota archaeon]